MSPAPSCARTAERERREIRLRISDKVGTAGKESAKSEFPKGSPLQRVAETEIGSAKLETRKTEGKS
ncbi:hypothetical protein, partial [Streptomyces sp. NPDC058745]|uniref:hypothetical protein n=1 Tax=Streptomyces sp. NPDC058745 TaxID=3346621 RepID=UPI0036B8F50B